MEAILLFTNLIIKPIKIFIVKNNKAKHNT